MKIWIYNPDSSGGNYEYAIRLAEAYNNSGTIQCKLILPVTTDHRVENEYQLLIDRVVHKTIPLSKISFIWRSLINPFILYHFLRRQSTKGIVLFNDFDQLSSPLWVPFYKGLKGKFFFGVLLHDPDRTQYPPHPRCSSIAMRKIMTLMDFALYHDKLPDLPYYKGFRGLWRSVPHGLYLLPCPDKVLYSKLKDWKGSHYLLGILGNIRTEKNYSLAIEALKADANLKLVIAGMPANSAVTISEYQESARKFGVNDRIFWHVDYLTEAQLSAVVEAVDLVLLYYKRSFTSQSGILNLIASRKKNVLISRTSSALTKLAVRYGIGLLVEPDDANALIKGIEQAKKYPVSNERWDAYIRSADWKQHAVVMEEIYSNLTTNENLAG